MIYLDSSALLKLLFEERESQDLDDWLTGEAGVPRVSSELSRVEVVRACRRLDETVVPAAAQLMAGLDTVPITSEILSRASIVGDPALRSLDAMHLASALSLGSELRLFVAYDRRLWAAARAEGLHAIAPGAD